MSRQVIVAVYLVVMVAIVVGVDVLFLRNQFWPRLASNIAIVAVFVAGYALFLRRR